MLPAWIAPVTSSTVRPKPVMRAGSTRTLISRSRAPMRSTVPTPGTCCMRCLTSSLAILVRSRIGRSPPRATESTGAAPVLNFWIHGRVDAAGQLALDGGDLVADVLEGLVAVDLELELEDDVGDALVVARGHALDAAERLERLLDRVGDLGLHGLRVGARVDHGGRDDGEVDAREQLDADARQAVEAEHHERGDHHRREHGPADRDLCDLHGVSFFGRGLLGGLDGLGGALGRAPRPRGGAGPRVDHGGLQLDLDVHAGAQELVLVVDVGDDLDRAGLGSTVGWMRTIFAGRVTSRAVK
jgi:hypothetical protein